MTNEQANAISNVLGGVSFVISGTLVVLFTNGNLFGQMIGAFIFVLGLTVASSNKLPVKKEN